MEHGALLPFGGAKGSGIAGMVNILSGLLVPDAVYENVISLSRDKNRPANYGCAIRMIDISTFIDRDLFYSRAERWGNAILSNPPARGFDRVVYPSYLEAERKKNSINGGIEISEFGLSCLRKGAELMR